MQDEVPCHTAKSVQKILLNKKIPLASWPANSPNLNSIPSDMSKFKVYSSENTTKEEVIQNIPNLCMYLCIVANINSIPRQIQVKTSAKVVLQTLYIQVDQNLAQVALES